MNAISFAATRRTVRRSVVTARAARRKGCRRGGARKGREREVGDEKTRKGQNGRSVDRVPVIGDVALMLLFTTSLTQTRDFGSRARAH